MSIKSDIYIIDETDASIEHIGLFCPMCSFMLCTHEDIQSVKDNKCCSECYFTFGQARKEDWQNVWRPDKDILDRYKQQRRILNIRIDDILGE